MDYSVDQAKSIFHLIESVSRYAFPLLISLVFPILWIVLKKLFGLSNSLTTSENAEPGNALQRIRRKIVSFFSLRGDFADKTIFYCSILLFFIGGIVLKIGEYKEEIVRQNTLSLKHHCENDGYLFYYRTSLNSKGYTDKMLDKILYNYPNEFLESGPNIVCVDSAVRANVIKQNHSLLSSYIREKFRTSNLIYLDSLFQKDNITNVKNLFSEDIVYSFLSANNDKFNISVIDTSTVIIKKE